MDKKTKIIVISCVSASAIGLVVILMLFLFAAPNAPFKAASSSSSAAAGGSLSAQSASAASVVSASSENAGGSSEGGTSQSQDTQSGTDVGGGTAVDEPADDELHIVTKDFEVWLPEYWRGKVDWSESVNKDGYARVDVYPVGYAEKTSYGSYKWRLVTFEAFPKDTPQVGGDIGNGRICLAENDQKVVTTWQTNWSYLAYEKQTGQYGGAKDYPESNLRMMIDLSLCGTMPYEDCADKSNQLATPDYLRHIFEDAVTVL